MISTNDIELTQQEKNIVIYERYDAFGKYRSLDGAIQKAKNDVWNMTELDWPKRHINERKRALAVLEKAKRMHLERDE